MLVTHRGQKVSVQRLCQTLFSFFFCTEALSDPFFFCKEALSDPFSYRKSPRKRCYHGLQTNHEQLKIKVVNYRPFNPCLSVTLA